MNPTLLKRLLKEKALELGFDLVGFVPAAPSPSIDIYKSWLQKGFAGSMDYLHRHAPLKEDPRTLLSETKSLVVLAMNYNTQDHPIPQSDPGKGQISRYAWGDDYHDLIREKLTLLETFYREQTHADAKSRSFVDSGPVLERELALRAGFGWIGKNGNLIAGKKGSWFFLAELLVETELEADLPFERIDCGSCTRCIQACPTQAIVENHTVNAQKCISYLTIELKGEIPEELRPKMGNWIFGCDVCQQVCPWNKKSPISAEISFQARPENVNQDLVHLLEMDQENFSKRFRKSPVKRTKRRGFLRNVAVALGNSKNRDAIPVLKKALQDPEPLIQTHAAWAIKQIEDAN